MSDKHFVGLKLTGFEDNGQNLPISRVTLKRDDNNMVTAGDDTGMELVADCPHATQAMCDAVLEQVRGYRYHAFTADDAGIDPAAELGDGVTAAGCYSVVSRLDDDGSGYPSLSAPGEPELEDEFPAEGPFTQEFNRKVTGVYSYINKTAEEIQLGIETVSNDVTEMESKFTVSLQGITSQMSSIDKRVTTISQSLESISLSVSNGEESSTISLVKDGITVSSKTIRFTGDIVFESGLLDGTTTISGDCISTGNIHVGGNNGANMISFDYRKEEGVGTLYTTENGIEFQSISGSMTIGASVDLEIGAQDITIRAGNELAIWDPVIYLTRSRYYEFHNDGIYLYTDGGTLKTQMV